MSNVSNHRIPDWTCGDVIAAYDDGTIVLDDGLTTWNPERAAQFLAKRGDQMQNEPPQITACSACGSTRVVHHKHCSMYDPDDERVEREMMKPDAPAAGQEGLRCLCGEPKICAHGCQKWPECIIDRRELSAEDIKRGQELAAALPQGSDRATDLILAKFREDLSHNDVLEQITLASWKDGANPSYSVDFRKLSDLVVDVLRESLDALCAPVERVEPEKLREALRDLAERVHIHHNGSGLPWRGGGYEDCYQHVFETCTSKKCAALRSVLRGRE